MYVKNLCIEHPGGTIPGRGIECRPEIEEKDGRNSSSGKFYIGVIGMCGRIAPVNDLQTGVSRA